MTSSGKMQRAKTTLTKVNHAITPVLLSAWLIRFSFLKHAANQYSVHHPYSRALHQDPNDPGLLLQYYLRYSLPRLCCCFGVLFADYTEQDEQNMAEMYNYMDGQEMDGEAEDTEDIDNMDEIYDYLEREQAQDQSHMDEIYEHPDFIDEVRNRMH